MKTKVYVVINEFEYEFFFNEPTEEFEKRWNNQVSAIGYFDGVDDKGKKVIITPSKCSLIVFSKTQ